MQVEIWLPSNPRPSRASCFGTRNEKGHGDTFSILEGQSPESCKDMKLFSHSLSLSLRDSQVQGVPRAAHEASPLLHLALDTQPHWGLCPLLLGLDKLQEIVFTVYQATATLIPAPSGFPWKLSSLWLRSWDQLCNVCQGLVPLPCAEPSELCPQLSAFPQSSFQPCTSGQGHPEPGGCPALLLRGHLVPEHPAALSSAFPGEAWGCPGLAPQASTSAERGEGMRAEAELGKLGSCFSFYFYLGTQVCYAEAPGGHTAFPSWSQIPSEHYLPFPVPVPDLQVEDSIARGTGTSCLAPGALQQEGRSGGAALQARSPCLQLLCDTSSQVTLGAAEQPCHTLTRPLPGSAAKC